MYIQMNFQVWPFEIFSKQPTLRLKSEREKLHQYIYLVSVKNGIEIKHPSFDQLTIHADSAIAFATNFPRTMCYLSHPFEE